MSRKNNFFVKITADESSVFTVSVQVYVDLSQRGFDLRLGTHYHQPSFRKSDQVCCYSSSDQEQIFYFKLRDQKINQLRHVFDLFI